MSLDFPGAYTWDRVFSPRLFFILILGFMFVLEFGFAMKMARGRMDGFMVGKGSNTEGGYEYKYYR